MKFEKRRLVQASGVALWNLPCNCEQINKISLILWIITTSSKVNLFKPNRKNIKYFGLFSFMAL